MRLFELLKRLGNDEDGASLLEYTVLLALLPVAVIGTVTLVGGCAASGQRSTVLCRPSEDHARPSRRSRKVQTLRDTFAEFPSFVAYIEAIRARSSPRRRTPG
jgi:Flp pilus assembly pilin Flp